MLVDQYLLAALQPTFFCAIPFMLCCTQSMSSLLSLNALFLGVVLLLSMPLAFMCMWKLKQVSEETHSAKSELLGWK